MKKITMQIPNEVRDILSELENAGHSAYIVGGAVRDAVMEKYRTITISVPQPPPKR